MVANLEFFHVSNGMANRSKMVSAFGSILFERMRVVVMLFIFMFAFDDKVSQDNNAYGTICPVFPYVSILDP